MFGEQGLEVSRWGTLKIDHRTVMTTLPGVFAAGDIVRGASLVVWAIRDGRDAAEQIHRIHRKVNRRWRSRRSDEHGVHHARRSQSTGAEFVAAWHANVARLADTYRPRAGARCLRRRPGRRARRQAAARRGAGRHRRAEGGLAPRRGGCRRQDRRRRRHPYRDPAGLLRRRGRAGRRRSCSRAAIAVGMVFLPKTDLGAQERCRQIVETEILYFGYAIYGWRQVPINVACIGEKANATRPEIEQIMIWNPSGTSDDEFRARPLRHPPPHREAGDRGADPRAVLLLAVLPLDHLQGHVPGGEPDRLLPGSARSALRLAASRSITSATRPTPSRPGGWRSRSACWRITARSTRVTATSTG